jgi:amino acid transporter
MSPEAINSVIDNLAIKLAVPAAKLMEVLPNLGFKTAVEFGLLVAFFGFGLFLIILGILAARYLPEVYEDCPCFVVGFVVVGGIIILVSFMIAAAVLPDFLLWRNYPDAWALDYVFKMLR